MTALGRSRLPWWIAWSIGVAIVPATSLLVPRDGTPFPLVLFLPDRTGLLVWSSWALAFGLMFLGMLGLRGAKLRSVVIAQLCASVVVATLTVAAPSSDPFAYAAWGEVEQRGANPWQPTPVTVNDDVMRVATQSWGNPIGAATYGPLFILAERTLLRFIPHTSTRELILVQRYLAAFAAIGVTLLVRGPRVAFWGLHPLVLFAFPLSAENDVFMLLLVAASMRIRQSFISGVALGLAAMVKLVAVGNIVFKQKRQIVATSLGMAVAAAALLAIEPKAATLTPLLHVAQQHQFGQGGTPTYLLQNLLESTRLPYPRLVAQAIVMATVLVLLYRTRRRWSRRDAALYGAMLLFAILPISNFNYVSWILFPALWASRPIRGVALTLTGAAWLLVLGVFMARHPHGITLVFWAVVALAYGYFFVLARDRHNARQIALELRRRNA
jgi:hypothetical protein